MLSVILQVTKPEEMIEGILRLLIRQDIGK